VRRLLALSALALACSIHSADAMGGRLRRLLSQFVAIRVLMEFVFGSPLRPRLNSRIEGMNP
jgi:hypothetical protein